MISAGIDVGAKFVKFVIMQDGKILAKSLEICGTDLKPSIDAVVENALKQAGITRDKIEKYIATGVGGDLVPNANSRANIVTSLAKSAIYSFPKAASVIDVGAEECRVLKFNEKGAVLEFSLNDKCAAGAGSFIEAISRALEVKLEEMGPMALRSKAELVMNTQCVIFAESEVVSLIHRKTPKEDIAKASYDAIANRVSAMARKIGVNQNIVLSGGMAKDIGFVDSLKRKMGTEHMISDIPEYASAIGALL